MVGVSTNWWFGPLNTEQVAFLNAVYFFNFGYVGSVTGVEMKQHIVCDDWEVSLFDGQIFA